MAECPHETFEVLPTVAWADASGTPYPQVRLQVRCAACQAPVLFPGLPTVSPPLYFTVATGAEGQELYVSGTMTPPAPPVPGPPLTPIPPGQTWTPAGTPEA